MTDFVDGLITGVRTAFCDLLEIEQNYFEWMKNRGFPTAQIPLLPIGVAYRIFCNREPPPAPAPPFTGGQCPVFYTVNYTVQYDTRSIPPPNIISDNFSLTFVRGKIQGLRVDRTSIHQVIIIGGAAGNPDQATDYGGFSIAPGSGQGIVTASITSVVRQDGLPDNCGNPPIVVTPPPPGWNQPDIDFTYQDNDGIDIDINGNFTFTEPLINIEGDVIVPIRVNLDNVNIGFNGTINLNNPEINFNFGNPNYAPSPLPSPDGYESPDDTPDVPPDVPQPTLPPSPDTPEPDTTRIIRGVIVTVTIVSPESSIIYQDDNPDIYVPDLGIVQFLIAVGQRIAWTSDLRVKNRRNFIECPWQGGAIDVRGTPRDGASFTLTPVYAVEEQVIEYEL